MSYDHALFPDKMPNEPEKATLEGKNKFMGFWFFLGGETVLFACLFGTYLALFRLVLTNHATLSRH